MVPLNKIQLFVGHILYYSLSWCRGALAVITLYGQKRAPMHQQTTSWPHSSQNKAVLPMTSLNPESKL